ncbi:helix-turn-helix domain-containing protein [Chitinimonas arctica]|uniref:Helix-turn-helix domain-containing protein n=1 Tax=Chitinimonas arctica TaxID=2594795 RepID=A0A516SAY9_9NEIS|nr:helix-turn-helix domain-containing protein [Chitinimonas arctica]
MNNHLLEVIESSGGRTKVAARLGVTYQGLNDWLNRGVVPPERVLPLCRSCDWRTTPHQIRADVYPHPDDGLPQAFRKQLVIPGESVTANSMDH